MMEYNNLIKNLIPVVQPQKQRNDKEFLILSDIVNGEMFYLNSNSKEFFFLIDGKRTVGNLIDELIKTYNAPAGEIEKDFISFLRDLQWKRLIYFKERENEEV